MTDNKNYWHDYWNKYYKKFWREYWIKKYPPDLIERIDMKRKLDACNNYARNHKEEIMFRDKFKCVKCGSKKELLLHHTKYENDFKYIKTLCKTCHDKIHNKKVWRITPLSERSRKILSSVEGRRPLFKPIRETKQEKKFRKFLTKKNSLGIRKEMRKRRYDSIAILKPPFSSVYIPV